MPAAVLLPSQSHSQLQSQTQHLPLTGSTFLPLGSSSTVPIIPPYNNRPTRTAASSSSAESSPAWQEVTGSDVLLPFLEREAEVMSLLLDTPSNSTLARKLGVVEPSSIRSSSSNDSYTEQGHRLSSLLFQTSRSQLDDRAWLKALRAHLIEDERGLKPMRQEQWRQLSTTLGAEWIDLDHQPMTTPATERLRSGSQVLSGVSRRRGSEIEEDEVGQEEEEDEAALDSGSDLSSLAPLSPRGSMRGGSGTSYVDETDTSGLPTVQETQPLEPQVLRDAKDRRPSFALTFASLPSRRGSNSSDSSGRSSQVHSPRNVDGVEGIQRASTLPRRRSRTTPSLATAFSPPRLSHLRSGSGSGSGAEIAPAVGPITPSRSTGAQDGLGRSRTLSSSSSTSGGSVTSPLGEEPKILRDAELLHLQRRRQSFARSFSDRSASKGKTSGTNTNAASRNTDEKSGDTQTSTLSQGPSTPSTQAVPVPGRKASKTLATSTVSASLAPSSVSPSPPTLPAISPILPLSTLRPSASPPSPPQGQGAQTPYTVAMSHESASLPKPEHLGLGKDGRTRHPSFSGGSPPKLSLASLPSTTTPARECHGESGGSGPAAATATATTADAVVEDRSDDGNVGCRRGRVVRLRRLSSASASPPSTCASLTSTSTAPSTSTSAPTQSELNRAKGRGAVKGGGAEGSGSTWTPTSTRRRKSVTFRDEVDVHSTSEKSDSDSPSPSGSGLEASNEARRAPPNVNVEVEAEGAGQSWEGEIEEQVVKEMNGKDVKEVGGKIL